MPIDFNQIADNKHFQKVFKKLGNFIVMEMREILYEGKKVASGKLVKSIKYKINQGEDFPLVIYYAAHGDNVIKGRRPGATPPPVRNIRKWLKQKGLYTYKKRSLFSKVLKGKVHNPNTPQMNEYSVSKSIGKYGIQPFDFTKPFKEVVVSSSELIANGLAFCYDDALDQMVKQLNLK